MSHAEAVHTLQPAAGATDQIVRFTGSLRYDALPEDARHHARRHLLDTVGVMIAGAPGDVGIVFNFYSRPEKDQKRRYGVAGHSFISVVDFGPQVQTRSILVFGENSDPKSKHYFDQSELYAKQQFKPAYFNVQ